jgi:hypothetical protein
MGTKRTPRIATRRAQRGVMLLMLILMFALPIIFMAYLGFVVNPGLDLVQNRMTQHQADYAALSLRWECEHYRNDDGEAECRTLNQNQDTTRRWDWPAPYAHTPSNLSERIALTVLQLITLSGNAHAEDSSCEFPDCLSGKKIEEKEEKIEEKEEKIEDGKVYIRFESNQDIRNPVFNATAEATMEVGVSDFDAPEIDGSIFDGFVGCENVEIGGNAEIINSNVYTTDSDSWIEVSGSAEIINSNVYTTDHDSWIEVSGNSDNAATIEGNVSSVEIVGLENIEGEICIRGDYEIEVEKSKDGKKKNKQSAFEHEGSLVILDNLTIGRNVEISRIWDGKLGKWTEGHLKVGGTLTIESGVKELDIKDPVEYVLDCKNSSDEDFCTGTDFSQVSEVSCKAGGASSGDDGSSDTESCDPIANNEEGNEESWQGIDDFFDLYSELAEDIEFSDIDDFSEIDGGYYKFEGLSLRNNLTITEDTVLHVKGDFKLTGNNIISVQGDASLTLMVEGDIDFTSGEISAETLVNEDDQGRERPQVAILSNGEDNSIKLAGNGNLKGVIYAPKSDVTISGTQSVTGSVRGKTLNINGTSGAEAIEYDSELINVQTIGSFIDTSTKPFLVK